MIEPDSAKQMMLVTGHGAHEKEFYSLLSLMNHPAASDGVSVGKF
jgi:hypothetical protein